MTLTARPVLAQRARVRPDKLRGGYVLLAPERGFRLNASAAAILMLCDGRRSLLQIAQGLVPPEDESQKSDALMQVLADVVGFVEQLSRRGLVKVSEP